MVNFQKLFLGKFEKKHILGHFSAYYVFEEELLVSRSFEHHELGGSRTRHRRNLEMEITFLHSSQDGYFEFSTIFFKKLGTTFQSHNML